jgi:uncharacterized protein YciU (UPF0263 family)
MAMVITLENVKDGVCMVKVKPEVGHAFNREFSKKALQEYVNSAQDYCENKGYDFMYLNYSENTFNLTEEQFDLFKWVHARHYAAWGTEARKKFTTDHIKKVVWDEDEDCLKVYYDSGDWWHYCKDGTWY